MVQEEKSEMSIVDLFTTLNLPDKRQGLFGYVRRRFAPGLPQRRSPRCSHAHSIEARPRGSLLSTAAHRLLPFFPAPPVSLVRGGINSQPPFLSQNWSN